MPKPTDTAQPLRRKASEEVAQRIVNHIVDNDLAAGARLPSEADMIEQYGVSRETLREALRLLEVQGFLSIRRGPGGGPTVEAVNAGFLARTSSLYYHLAGASYDEVFSAWEMLEPPLAALAASNPDRARVKDLLGQFLDEEKLADPNVVMPSMHALIAELSGNRVMRLTAQTIGHIVTDQILDSLTIGRARELIAHGHAEIAEAVIKGHKRRALDLMADHIHAVTSFYRTEYPDRMGDPIVWR